MLNLNSLHKKLSYISLQKYNLILKEDKLVSLSSQEIKYILKHKNNKKQFIILLKDSGLFLNFKKAKSVVDSSVSQRVQKFRENQKKNKKVLVQFYIDFDLREKIKTVCQNKNITMQDYFSALLSDGVK